MSFILMMYMGSMMHYYIGELKTKVESIKVNKKTLKLMSSMILWKIKMSTY